MGFRGSLFLFGKVIRKIPWDVYSAVILGEKQILGQESKYTISTETWSLLFNKTLWLGRGVGGGGWGGLEIHLWDLCCFFLFHMDLAGEGGRGPWDAAARNSGGGLDSAWGGAKQWDVSGHFGVSEPGHFGDISLWVGCTVYSVWLSTQTLLPRNSVCCLSDQVSL